MSFKHASAFRFASKRAAAVAATLALAFAGLVAGTATPAQAADSALKYNVRVNREVVAGEPAVIRPGETVSVYVAAYLDNRYNSSTLISDLVADDVLTFDVNFSSTLTPANPAYNWYVTGQNPCYGLTLPQTETLTWTEAIDTCGGGEGAEYLNPYWSARLTNDTTENVTFTVDPKLMTPAAADGIASGTEGFRVDSSATFEASGVTSYTASAADSSVLFDTLAGLCVSRDLAVGSAFVPAMSVTADGQTVSTTDDGSNTYADVNLAVRHLPIGETYATQNLKSYTQIVGYEVTAGRVTLTTDGPHNLNYTYVDLVNTGVTELDAIDSSYAWSDTPDTLIIHQSTALADTAYTTITSDGVAEIISTEGGQYNKMPADTQGVKVSASANIYRPVANAVYTASMSVVDYADGTTSVARDCGPATPTFTIDTASSTYNSIAVAIDQTVGAGSYSCRAYNSAGNLVYTGNLQETSRATGSKCQIYALSPSTTYTIKVAAYSYFEGEGPESDGTTHTTIAGGGGGGYTPPAMVTPTLGAPSGHTAIKVSTPAIKSMNSAITVTDTSRAYAGANGDVFYGSVAAGSATIVNNTASGANTKFAGSGKLVIPGVSGLTSVGWIGAKGTGFAVVYRDTSFNTAVKWGSLNSASGMKTATVPAAKISAFCTTNAGAGYNVGNLILASSPMAAPLVRIDCNDMTDGTKPTRILFATVAASSTTPLVKTSAQITNYASTAYPCVNVSMGTNKAATSSTSAHLLVATTYAKTVLGGISNCQPGSGTVYKREVLSMSGSGKKLASSVPTSSVITTDVTGFSAVPGKSANTWVVLTSTNGSMNSMPGMKYIMTVDSKGKAVKGKNITYSSAAASSNAKFAGYSIISAVGQLSSGTITGVRSGNVASGASNQSWAAVSISLSTGVVTTGQAITITASSYTGTMTSARNLNITSATSDSKKVNVYVLADAEAKKYKAATWTLPTK